MDYKSLAALVACCASLHLRADETLYTNNFEKAELDKVPSEFLVLDGAFAVKEADGNKFLELPGAPLDTFGVIFGPTVKENISVTARAFGTKKGRRFPSFGLGLGGPAGYKIKVSPAKEKLELYKGDNVVASAPLQWESGKWISLRLFVAKKGDAWIIQGRHWTGNEPSDWQISWEEKDSPPEGRSSVTAEPYATTPIRFDDIAVVKTP